MIAIEIVSVLKTKTPWRMLGIPSDTVSKAHGGAQERTVITAIDLANLADKLEDDEQFQLLATLIYVLTKRWCLDDV